MRLGEGRLDHHLAKMKVPLRNSCVGVCAVQSDCQHDVGSGMVDGGMESHVGSLCMSTARHTMGFMDSDSGDGDNG